MAAQIPGVAALSPEGCQTILADQLPLELGQPPGDADNDVAVDDSEEGVGDLEEVPIGARHVRAAEARIGAQDILIVVVLARLGYTG